MRVYRVCVGHDCGQIINPDGLANQIEGGVIQMVSRTLPGQVEWNRSKVTSVDWATYPILRFPDAPRVEVDMINIPGVVSMGSPVDRSRQESRQAPVGDQALLYARACFTIVFGTQNHKGDSSHETDSFTHCTCHAGLRRLCRAGTAGAATGR